MGNPRPAGTYDKENSCIEDVLAIANELARQYQVIEDPDAKNSDASTKKTKGKAGTH